MSKRLLSCLVYSAGVMGTSACHRDPLAKYGPDERLYVERAIELYSGNGKISRAEVFRRVDPVVVYLPDMTCVGMNLRRGVVGGDSTVCFDKSGRRVLTYRIGD